MNDNTPARPRLVPGADAVAAEFVHHCDEDYHLEIQGFDDEINAMVDTVHGANVHAGWWSDITKRDPETGIYARRPRNVGEMLCLIHSEISEAMEAHRKGLMDDKLPHRPGIEVELADAMIRILDLAGRMQLDLGGAVVEKLQFNAKREDHKIEVRLGPNGKAF